MLLLLLPYFIIILFTEAFYSVFTYLIFLVKAAIILDPKKKTHNESQYYLSINSEIKCNKIKSQIYI